LAHQRAPACALFRGRDPCEGLSVERVLQRPWAAERVGQAPGQAAVVGRESDQAVGLAPGVGQADPDGPAAVDLVGEAASPAETDLAVEGASLAGTDLAGEVASPAGTDPAEGEAYPAVGIDPADLETDQVGVGPGTAPGVAVPGIAAAVGTVVG